MTNNVIGAINQIFIGFVLLVLNLYIENKDHKIKAILLTANGNGMVNKKNIAKKNRLSS